MHIHFSWTKFTFEPPRPITEAQYAAARERPDELRLSARGRIRAAARTAAIATVIPAAIAAGCFGLAGRFDFADRRSWSATIGVTLVVIGVALAFSAVLTAGSFLHYAAAVTGF